MPCWKFPGSALLCPEFRLIVLVGFGGFRGVPLHLDFSPRSVIILICVCRSPASGIFRCKFVFWAARCGLLHPAVACRRCAQRRMGPFLRTRNFARHRMGWFHDVLLLALHPAFRRPFRHWKLIAAAVIGAAVFLGHVLFFRLLWRHRALINPRLSPVRDRHGRRA